MHTQKKTYFCHLQTASDYENHCETINSEQMMRSRSTFCILFAENFVFPRVERAKLVLVPLPLWLKAFRKTSDTHAIRNGLHTKKRLDTAEILEKERPGINIIQIGN
jgi:hypothetical protein